MKKYVSLFLSIILLFSISFNVGNAQVANRQNKKRSQKDVSFIVKHYKLNKEDVLELPDVTFDAMKSEAPASQTEETKYFAIRNSNDPQISLNSNEVHSLSTGNTLVSDVERDIVYVEITEYEFNQAKQNLEERKGQEKGQNTGETFRTLSDNQIYKDFGWVALTTRISYQATSDQYVISNNTNYLQYSYYSLSDTIGYFTGIGTNYNMSIINTSPYFRLSYTRHLLFDDGSTLDYSHWEPRHYADKTNSDGYGWYFELYDIPSYSYSNIQLVSNVIAKKNVSNLSIADAYGHFAHKKGTIDVAPTVGVTGANVNLSPNPNITKINPIHVQIVH